MQIDFSFTSWIIDQLSKVFSSFKAARDDRNQKLELIRLTIDATRNEVYQSLRSLELDKPSEFRISTDMKDHRTQLLEWENKQIFWNFYESRKYKDAVNEITHIYKELSSHGLDESYFRSKSNDLIEKADRLSSKILHVIGGTT